MRDDIGRSGTRARRTCILQWCLPVVPLGALLFPVLARDIPPENAMPDFTQPNIVFFLVDDMGWQETSVPFHAEETELNRRYRTPNMERLAASGMKFTQAYACAVCSPTRVSLMTGMNAARHGVTCWTLRKDRSPEGRHPRIQPPPWNLNGLSRTPGTDRTVVAETLPARLQQAGYRTIHVGKAHFGAKGTPGEDPLHLGFDVNIAGHAAGGPGSYHGTNNFSAAWRQGDRIWDVPGLRDYHGRDINLTEALTREAIEAVRRAVADHTPFYLYLAHYAIHAPWEKDARFYQPYIDRGLTPFEATYASMVESMDKSLGDILDLLERLGVANRTVVVFMSDNGSPSQAPRNLPLRGHKLTPYEGGIRVPMLVYWPGITRPGSTSGAQVIIEDVYPTFLELAGVGLPPAPDASVDGVSLVPWLKDETPAGAGRPLFWHYPNTYDQPPYSAVRRGDWKLIYHHATRRLELFNLHADIGEKQDLSRDHPNQVEQLAGVLTEFLRSSGGKMPTDRESGLPVEYPSEAWRRAASPADPDLRSPP